MKNDLSQSSYSHRYREAQPAGTDFWGPVECISSSCVSSALAVLRQVVLALASAAPAPAAAARTLRRWRA
jgi:hypothetical protein